MSTPLRALIVEDSADDVLLVLRELRSGGYDVTSERVETAETMRAALDRSPWDIVISDYRMPRFSGLAALELLRSSGRDLPFILVSGTVGEDLAVTAMKAGAHDYLMKDRLARLVSAVQRELRDVVARRERKQAEEALRRSEEKFRCLFESSQDAIMTLDPPSWKFTSGNAACVKTFGAKNEVEFISYGPADLSPDRQPDGRASAEKFVEMIETAMRNGSHFFEWTHRRIGGKDFLANVLLTRMEQSGKVVLQATVRDITEFKLAEHKLREQNEILSNSHEGVMIVNLANEVTLWNRGAKEMFSWTEAEALGRPPEQLLGVDDLGVMSTMRAAIERDGYWNGELRAQTRDGRKRILECRVTLVRDEADRPHARLNFFTDITEKKLLQEKFLHVQRLENLGLLASGIAHDLNNMLAPIVFAGPLLRENMTAPRDLEILNILERSANRGAGLVRQILAFSHSTTGEPRLTQIKHIAQDIISMVEGTFPKSIRFEHHIPSDAWPVMGNPTQLHQVFLNFCVNARDAMPHGGTLRISAANRRLSEEEAMAIPGVLQGAWLVLEFADTGTGIPPEVLEHIWEPFFTTKDERKGTGLGLSTVRDIIANHHGVVKLQTEVGHGTTFRVFLPAIDKDATSPDSTSPSGIAGGHGELILLVDDDKAVRDMVATILGNHGYRVLSCPDGVEAIGVFTANIGAIALVITDVDMPNLDGLALVRILLQLRPQVRLLVMSGLSGSSNGGVNVKSTRELAHAFLLKPFKPDALLGTMHQVLHPQAKP